MVHLCPNAMWHVYTQESRACDFDIERPNVRPKRLLINRPPTEAICLPGSRTQPNPDGCFAACFLKRRFASAFWLLRVHRTTRGVARDKVAWSVRLPRIDSGICHEYQFDGDTYIPTESPGMSVPSFVECKTPAQNYTRLLATQATVHTLLLSWGPLRRQGSFAPHACRSRQPTSYRVGRAWLSAGPHHHPISILAWVRAGSDPCWQ